MLDEQAREDLIEKISAIFTNEAEAASFEEDPDGYVAEHLPEGVEGADVASCLPAVGERTGLDFTNVASTGGGASAAGQISHTYTTVYQQNAFIYAEEGAQVTNIQGDGNAVAQQDIDVDVDVDYGQGEDTPVEEPLDEAPVDETPEGEFLDPHQWAETHTADLLDEPHTAVVDDQPHGGYEEPVWDEVPEAHDAPVEAYEVAEPAVAEPVDDMVDV